MTHKPISLDDKTLIFLHIQKCAGNSFIEILDAFYRKKDMLKAHLLHAGAPEIQRPIGAYRVIIGHNTWDDIMAMQPSNPVFMTVLRDPIARVTSLYHFWRSHRWQHIEQYNLHGPRLAKTLSFAEFIDSEEPEARLNVRNGQARQFVNGLRGPTGLSDDELFRISSKRLHQCAFIGLTEHFELSVRLLCHTFSWLFPSEMPQENISAKNVVSDSRYEPIEQTRLDDSARKRLIELNDADIRLYAYAEQLFRKRYDTIQTERQQQRKLQRPLLVYRLKKKLHFR